MTVMIESDTRGVDALSGKLDDSVTPPPLHIFDELMAEMGSQFPAVPLQGQELEFDEQPWRELPTIEDLEYLWAASPLGEMLHRVAVAAHGGGEDFMRYLAEQRQHADWEYELREARHAEQATVDVRGAEEAGPVASAETLGGGGAVPGGSEDGDAVGEGGEAAVDEDHRRASTVPRKRRPRGAKG